MKALIYSKLPCTKNMLDNLVANVAISSIKILVSKYRYQVQSREN